jgi:hypothetical protein
VVVRVVVLLVSWSLGALVVASPAQAQTSAETAAVNWATAQIGSTAWPGLCLSFVYAAYKDGAGVNLEGLTSGVAYNANTDPQDVWGHTSAGTTGTGTPPYGALVFFDAKSGYNPEDYSHVTIMGANGEMISSPDVVNESAVHYETLAQHAGSGAYDTYVGWWLPDGSTTTPPAQPPDGTFVSYAGNVYRIAGGAPIYVSNWAAVGGAQPTEALTASQWSALNAVPANGTLISSTATGMVYEIAGGAPLYVSNFAAIGGPRSVVGVDQWDLDNITSPLAHLNAVPADGTLVGASAGGPFGGGVFVIAGGAPLYVSNWAAIGGPQTVVGIDEWDIANITNPAAHLNAVPANGTFINTSTGHVYRIAGGAPFAVSSWSVFGGMQPYVTVDEWDLDNMASPLAHLNAMPASGTVVQGIPSGSYWSFSGGYRSPTDASSSAVGIDDVGLAAFPLQPAQGGGATSTPEANASGGSSSANSNSPPTPSAKPGDTILECVVPNLKNMSLGAARTALTTARCRLGNVRRPRRIPRGHVLRVSAQSVKSGSGRTRGYPVGITLKAVRK